MTLPHPTSHFDRPAAERLYTRLATTAAARADQQRRRRRIAHLSLVAAASLLALVAGLVVVRSMQRADHSPTAAAVTEPAPAPPPMLTRGGRGFGRSLGPPWSAKRPLIGGRPVSLGEAQTALGRPIPLAQDPLANQRIVGRITLATDGRIHGKTDTFVAISYPKSRLAIDYETPVPYPDPAANYRGYVQDDKQDPRLKHLAVVGSVAGRPALIMNLDADSLRTNPASVEFVYRGIRIAVIGYQSSSALLGVAGSIIKSGR